MLTLAQVVLRNNCATKVVAAISVASWKLHATPVYTPRDAGVVSIALQPHAANGKGVSGPFLCSATLTRVEGKWQGRTSPLHLATRFASELERNFARRTNVEHKS